METRLNRPDHLAKHSVTAAILTLETSVWKPGLIVPITWQMFCDRDDSYVRDECMETRLNRPDHLANIL